MKGRTLILIEGSRANGPLYVQAAQRLGLHLITLSADPAQYDYLGANEVQTICVDTDDLDALIRECYQLSTTYEIAGITGFPSPSETVYATVARLCRHFTLPGPDPASIDRCCDKFVQRQVLAEYGVPVPAYRLATDAMEVECSAEKIGLPVILKPTAGLGGSGVRLCRDAKELAQHTSHLLDGDHPWQSSPKILVEEFAQGPYYGANTMGNQVIAIGTADFGPPPHFVFREYTFPAPLTETELQRIIDVSLSCLRALGLGWGPANIEFRWTNDGPVVIEVNPRLPTGEARLVQLAYGVDLITAHINLVIGQQICDLRAKHSHIAAVRSLLPEGDGILDWISGDNRAAAVPGVNEVKFYVTPKAQIVRRGDYLDSIGHVIACSSSRSQTEMMLERAVNLIRWSIAPFPSLCEPDEISTSISGAKEAPREG
ncbi:MULTISPECIES: ATP-grasp domain-containing protein [Rhizobium]|uniref:ATP-grasp domain-containing protein n=3 Tax=Rhizobium TaxID=379 RepID=A0A6P1CKV1_RHITR|nr:MULTISPECIES: acetyl-CoA carboxylase biotin carboxylase subunit family protein [Rhizobium]AGB73650.1 ATP-dependent carboxylate-amine/thiol ligase, ATP-grasp fold superfamily [Rhizobium tropici CIAT 899]AYG70559.1 ATP-grasp domain-containing protein [Rhizobium sp. CCGE531]ENN83934.1 ATP-dependent carboxylate-amine/thiol ligase, ATP-grasp fold superfamily [Rhizobium freirei PRF 81]MBB4245522.1 biotin carboxylase [Rhizobium tropici]MBB5596812.1 biotin carboxylase [Rhizobium tropici]